MVYPIENEEELNGEFQIRELGVCLFILGSVLFAGAVWVWVASLISRPQ